MVHSAVRSQLVLVLVVSRTASRVKLLDNIINGTLATATVICNILEVEVAVSKTTVFHPWKTNRVTRSARRKTIGNEKVAY